MTIPGMSHDQDQLDGGYRMRDEAVTSNTFLTTLMYCISCKMHNLSVCLQGYHQLQGNGEELLQQHVFISWQTAPFRSLSSLDIRKLGENTWWNVSVQAIIIINLDCYFPNTLLYLLHLVCKTVMHSFCMRTKSIEKYCATITKRCNLGVSGQSRGAHN